MHHPTNGYRLPQIPPLGYLASFSRLPSIVQPCAGTRQTSGSYYWKRWLIGWNPGTSRLCISHRWQRCTRTHLLCCAFLPFASLRCFNFVAEPVIFKISSLPYSDCRPPAGLATAPGICPALRTTVNISRPTFRTGHATSTMMTAVISILVFQQLRYSDAGSGWWFTGPCGSRPRPTAFLQILG